MSSARVAESGRWNLTVERAAGSLTRLVEVGHPGHRTSANFFNEVAVFRGKCRENYVQTEHGRIDVLIHNAGHMVVGPAEAFTPEQLAEMYNVNVLSTQRVKRAALPGMRHRGEGLVVWVSSSSVKGGTPHYVTQGLGKVVRVGL